MPVNPFVTPEIVLVDYNLIRRVEAYIDLNLLDSDWLKKWQYGTAEEPYYQFNMTADDLNMQSPVVAALTDAEKDYLTTAYLAVGWGKVRVSNSSDNGECSGIISIILHK